MGSRTIDEGSMDEKSGMNFSEYVNHLRVEEAKRLGSLFFRMIKGEATEEEIDSLEEASVLRDISHMPARVKCAVLGWHTLEEMFGSDN